ncbi:hypothetical protein AQI88_27770 [Streptomyces cellostaticus]|uniref:Uncharacterized protein n=2 Tax=Streptomyces cellostaticus TaxID=67285 RepID=A0A101NHS6_9ACTN|nr:hypothetical protein AQI88_27770 [Streptomyces cellostaticus]GHI09574.1 hypothetical protein Scel_78950 [Streptomyces cellostaticus]
MGGSGVTSPRPGQWVGPAEAVLPVYSELRRRGIQCYLLHAFQPDASDRPERYGALLSLIPETEANLRADFPALLETDDGRVALANQSTLDLLAPVTKGVEWTGRADGPLSELAAAPSLPEPVLLVTAFNFDQGTTGSWMIAHDGRMVLTESNLKFLHEHGMAWSDSYMVKGERYPVAPFLMFAGRVSDLLLSRGVEFSDPPIYVIDRAVADSVDTGDEEHRS